MLFLIPLGIIASNACIAHGVMGLVGLHAVHVGISTGVAHIAGGVLGKAIIAGAATL
jgi:hypothetical protein